uniref:Membrane protein n=1 Tax=Thermosporothrix sp. COM3 TaxID=2490863 RepID=A0A455SLK8_9CHLR|nr:membrane protein [Thermosporothrix sp. COM3]
MMLLSTLLIILGGICTGLCAGVFFAFPVAIVPALRAMEATQHIKMMIAINKKIENPIFLFCFFSPAIILPIAAFLLREDPAFWLLVIAAILHIVGSIGITALGNIPINKQVETIDLTTTPAAEIEQQRTRYQGPNSRWMQLHALRTLAAIVATGLVVAVGLI